MAPPAAGGLLVVDWWEKLAGASLALAALTRLCSSLHLHLAAPSVRSSTFVPFAEGARALPLAAYYDTRPLRAALAPARLVSPRAFFAAAARDAPRRALLLLVYDDHPRACRLAAAAAAAAPCAAACLPSVQRWTPHHGALANATAGWPRACLRSSALAAAIRGEGGSPLGPYRQLVLLNFRRHDRRRPMMPAAEALRRRAEIVRPAGRLRAAAREFLRRHGLPEAYAVVQLRTNHLAHSAHVRGGAENCSRLVAHCVRRLSRAARRLAPASATVVASDLNTLFWDNQDGVSHHRHGYVRTCLRPAVGRLRRWHDAAGVSFNCSVDGVGMGEGLGSGGRCDAGALGLLDLVLASEAKTFVAVDVKLPWRSAFLDWILQLRKLSQRPSTIISCD